jgi:hypothetical protein
MGVETHGADGTAPCWVEVKLQQHSQEKNGGVCGQVLSAGGAFYYHRDMKPGYRLTPRGTPEWPLYNGIFTIPISRKSPNTLSKLFHEALSMEHL